MQMSMQALAEDRSGYKIPRSRSHRVMRHPMWVLGIEFGFLKRALNY